jgi:hypothetical protein
MLATTPRLCVVRTSLSGLLWWKHTISISKWLDTTTDLVMTSSQAGDILIFTIPLNTVRLSDPVMIPDPDYKQDGSLPKEYEGASAK